MAWRNAGRWGPLLRLETTAAACFVCHLFPSHGQVADRLTKLEREKEDLHFRHLWLVEHVNFLGKRHEESAEKQLQELTLVQNRLDAFHGRLGHAEVEGATLDMHDSALKDVEATNTLESSMDTDLLSMMPQGHDRWDIKTPQAGRGAFGDLTAQEEDPAMGPEQMVTEDGQEIPPGQLEPEADEDKTEDTYIEGKEDLLIYADKKKFVMKPTDKLRSFFEEYAAFKGWPREVVSQGLLKMSIGRKTRFVLDTTLQENGIRQGAVCFFHKVDSKKRKKPASTTKETKQVKTSKMKRPQDPDKEKESKRKLDDPSAAFTKGIELEAFCDGEFWPASVVTVSVSKSKKMTPVKVSYTGFPRKYDEWLPYDRLRFPEQGKAGEDVNESSANAGKENEEEKASERTCDDPSAAFTKGMELEAFCDGEFWPASVVTVSASKSKKMTPVKVSYTGFPRKYDEWLPYDRLRFPQQGAGNTQEAKKGQKLWGVAITLPPTKVLACANCGVTTSERKNVWGRYAYEKQEQGLVKWPEGKVCDKCKKFAKSVVRKKPKGPKSIASKYCQLNRRLATVQKQCQEAQRLLLDVAASAAPEIKAFMESSACEQSDVD